MRFSNNRFISIRLMGAFRLEVGGKDCTHLLTYDKVKLFLAVLCVSPGRSITRARVADMLWPDSPDSKGRARVRHALHTLRQALAGAGDCLINDADGLRLVEDRIWVDVLDIVHVPAQLTQQVVQGKLDLCTGAFLDDVKQPSSELLGAWVQNWTARLDMELAQWRNRLVSICLDRQDTRTALHYAKTWVHQWPEEEACHRLLIRLLLLTGDRDAALAAFRHCCEILGKRLGVVPSAETRALLGLERQMLSTRSLAGTDSKEASYRPIATVAIALAWRPEPDALVKAGDGYGLEQVDDADFTHAHDMDMEEDAHEDIQNAIQAGHERLIVVARQHGAWLPHTGTTTVLAHFGYPALSEHPIVQAIRLARDLARLDTGSGISIGLAIHADLVLLGSAQDLSLNGLLCQTAVPLAWQADNREILLSTAAVARMADWPVEAVLRADQQYFRLNPDTPPTQVVRMHGRLREFDTLVQQWNRHRPGQPPALVHVHGQAGLGKTQLIQAMTDYARNVNGRVIALHSEENQNETPLHAIHPWLRDQLGLSRSASVANWTLAEHEQIVVAMQSRFGLSVDACHALLGTMLAGSGVHAIDAYQAAIEAALTALLHPRDDERQPVLIAWDNTHWNDAVSHALLKKLARARSMTLTMVICASRQTMTDPPPTIHLPLGPLETSATAEYVAHKARSTKLSREVRADLVARSAGVPMHIAELLHLSSLGLPSQTLPRVTDRLSVFLLRLCPVSRNLAYLAALLPEFDEPSAGEILDLDECETARAVDTLLEAGIVERKKNRTQLRCNPIIGSSIHRLIVRRRKQDLCGRIARHLVRQRQPAAIVARQLHWARSAEAGSWWHRAIQEALRQGSLDHATRYIARALESGQYIKDVHHRRRLEFACHVAQNTLEAAISGPAAPRAILAYQRAARSCPDDDPATTLAVLWSEWVVQHNLGNLSASLHIARRLHRIASDQRHQVWQGWALYAQAQFDLWIGNPVAAESLLRQSLTLLRQSAEDDDVSAYGSHSYALAYAALGLAQALQGRYSAAIQNTRHAIQLASQNLSPASAIACQLHLLRIHYLANNLQGLQTGEAITLPQPADTGASVWMALLDAYALLPQALNTPTTQALQTLQAALSIVQTNMPVATDGYLCLLARCHIATNKPEQSLQLLNKATAIGEARKSRLMTSEIHCIRGDAWIAMDRPDLAQQEWHKARQVAHQYSLLAYDEWASERLQAVAN